MYGLVWVFFPGRKYFKQPGGPFLNWGAVGGWRDKWIFEWIWNGACHEIWPAEKVKRSI